MKIMTTQSFNVDSINFDEHGRVVIEDEGVLDAIVAGFGIGGGEHPEDNNTNCYNC